MNWFRRNTGLLPALVAALMKKPDTVSYPFTPLELPQGFRGAIVIDPEKCTGCGLCVRDCPANALELFRESRENFRLIHFPGRCAYCGQCQDACRHGAISNSNQIVGATIDPDSLTLVLKDSAEDK